ncbi:MAG: PKD domain-containing protein [Flavobacteriales bacterium]|nr:PKD domain-containing protein [Flavobacteriales bacterium]
MNKLGLISLLALSGSVFSQTLDAGIDDTICPPETATLTATFAAGPGTDVPSTTSYLVSDIPYAPDAYGGTAVVLTDDSQTGLLPIGFSFDFYGNTYTDFVICSNNWIGFSSGETSTWVTNTVPSAAIDRPKNCIMGPWQDINPGTGGTIQYQTLGVAPCRRLVVTYETVPMFSCTALIFSAQIIIYEGSNVIENHIEAKPICTTWNSGNAVQALHNIDGTQASVYPGRNNTNWAVTTEAVRWTPDGPLAPFPYSIDWYEVGSGTWLGSGLTVDVSPTVTTDYEIVVSSCLDGVIAADTVTVYSICCEAPVMDSTMVTCNGAADGTATATGMGIGPWTYLWDDPAGQTTSTATGLAPGTYTCTVTDAAGCIETGSVTITEPDAIVTTINSTTDASCELLNGEIDVSAVGGTAPITYSLDGGVTTAATGVYTDLDGGDYIVTVEDSNGCVETVPITLLDPPMLTVTETVVNETCEGLCDGSIVIDATTAAGPFSYSIDGGFTTTGASSFESLCDGAYFINVTDENGCVYSNTVNVVGGPPIADATITSFGPLCINNGIVDMTAATPGGVWSGTGVSGSSFDPFIAGPGTHTITYAIDGVCGDTRTLDVTVNDFPTVNPSTDIQEGCDPVLVNFFNVGTAGSCLWTFGDGSTSTACAGVSHLYSTPGIFDVSLTVTDDVGCSNTVVLDDHIEVFEQPVAAFAYGPQPATTFDSEITFTDNSTGADQYEWFFAGLGTSTDPNPSFTFPDVGQYNVTLHVEGDGGCVDDVTRPVIIDDIILFYVPNVFTPDGDEFNENFKPVMTAGFDYYDYHFTVYNKWGEILFESFDALYGWDGTYGNRGLIQDGTYIWQIEFKEEITDKRHVHLGHVTILR